MYTLTTYVNFYINSASSKNADCWKTFCIKLFYSNMSLEQYFAPLTFAKANFQNDNNKRGYICLFYILDKGANCEC